MVNTMEYFERPIDPFNAIKRAREAFNKHITKSVQFRINQLKQLQRCIDENYEEFFTVLKADLNKPRMEALVSEIELVKNDIQYQLKYIHRFVKPYRQKKGLANIPDGVYTKYDPFGVVLIISPWNYPVYLTLCPLIGAITAGNCAIVKPSELSSNSANLFAKLLPKYLDQECYHIINGGPEVATTLLQERFDLIFFTGSTSIARIVYSAAVKHLTPVILELGGKNPVYFDDTVTNFEVAVKRLVWSKCINSGQICVTPDYLLCSGEIQEKFLILAKKFLKEFYGQDPKKSDSFCHIINQKHFDRLENLIKSTKGKVEIGGDCDRQYCCISPTIVSNVDPSDILMNEEIFGPILPIININSVDEAIEFINSREKPLALYVFSSNEQVQQRFQNETSSGSLTFNDCLFHLAVETLPFGGVGNSGIGILIIIGMSFQIFLCFLKGKYRGQYSMEAFSHCKGILKRSYDPLIEKIGSARYPPFNERKLRRMKMLLTRNFLNDIDLLELFPYVLAIFFGMILAVLLEYLYAIYIGNKQ